MDIVDLKGTEFAINLIDSGIYTQKQLPCNVTGNDTVTESNAIEEEKEEDKNKNNKKKKKSEFDILIENQTENLKII